MLCVDPKRRITLKEIVQHRWMSNCDPEWTRYKNLSSEIAREDESLIDEKILLKCSALFPDIDLNTLRLKIQSDCDYHCATYWLVKQRPELYKVFLSHLFYQFHATFFFAGFRSIDSDRID